MTSISAAGVLPVSNYKGQDYYYFGHEKKTNTLTAFLGKRDPKHGKLESPGACAARELKEESIGVFKTGSSSLESTAKKVVNASCKQITYIKRVKSDGNPVKKFQKKRAKKGLKGYQKEMSKMVCVKAHTLRSIISSGKTSYNGIPFRSDTLKTLQIASSSGTL